MNRINQLFKTNPKNLLSVYFCAGHPELEKTAELIHVLERNGIHMIEIGIPFSDPVADGVVIQNASTKALRNGMRLNLLFEQLQGIRQEVKIPLLLMGYLNPIMQFGFESFCQKCSACGIDGMIIPDLPFKEYREHYQSTAEQYGLHVIMLITPQTSEERIREIDRNTNGFIYMVSSAATTGVQQGFDEQKQTYFKRIGNLPLQNPLMVGFGISNRTTFEAACQYAAGGIVGSLFISLLEEEKDTERAVKKLLNSLSQ
jgi:tryptophan synthase alpha chain